mmetsp:Transcript_2273/g.8417  ORF Transcript_2273/g.8417 Transcript_2273/m.8417 type:complete len:87 (+) Transcript_2273:4887-5147(+)
MMNVFGAVLEMTKRRASSGLYEFIELRRRQNWSLFHQTTSDKHQSVHYDTSTMSILHLGAICHGIRLQHVHAQLFQSMNRYLFMRH